MIGVTRGEKILNALIQNSGKNRQCRARQDDEYGPKGPQCKRHSQ